MVACGASPHACTSDFFMLITKPYGTASAVMTFSALVSVDKCWPCIARSSAKAWSDAALSIPMALEILCSDGSM